MADDERCPRCGGATAGWICALCGAEADEHNPRHLHGGSDRYCTLLCRDCGLADVHCTCEATARAGAGGR